MVLVLAAAGLHAGWTLVLHGSEDRPAVMAVAGLVAGVALLPALVIEPPSGVVGLVVLSGAAEAAYALSLSAAYRRGGLSIAYPVARGTAPLVVTLLAFALLSQTPAPAALAGAVSLAAGLGWLAVEGRRRLAGAAVGFGLLTGVVIALYSTVDARAVRTAAPVGYLAAVMLVQGLILTAGIRVDPVRLRRALPGGAAVAVGSTAAYLLVLFAFQRAAAGRVATLREVAVLVGILLSGERPGRAVWLAAVLVVAGAVLAGA